MKKNRELNNPVGNIQCQVFLNSLFQLNELVDKTIAKEACTHNERMNIYT